MSTSRSKITVSPDQVLRSLSSLGFSNPPLLNIVRFINTFSGDSLGFSQFLLELEQYYSRFIYSGYERALEEQGWDLDDLDDGDKGRVVSHFKAVYGDGSFYYKKFDSLLRPLVSRPINPGLGEMFAIAMNLLLTSYADDEQSLKKTTEWKNRFQLFTEISYGPGLYEYKSYAESKEKKYVEVLELIKSLQKEVFKYKAKVKKETLSKVVENLCDIVANLSSEVWSLERIKKETGYLNFSEKAKLEHNRLKIRETWQKIYDEEPTLQRHESFKSAVKNKFYYSYYSCLLAQKEREQKELRQYAQDVEGIYSELIKQCGLQELAQDRGVITAPQTESSVDEQDDVSGAVVEERVVDISAFRPESVSIESGVSSKVDEGDLQRSYIEIAEELLGNVASLKDDKESSPIDEIALFVANMIIFLDAKEKNLQLKQSSMDFEGDLRKSAEKKIRIIQKSLCELEVIAKDVGAMQKQKVTDGDVGAEKKMVSEEIAVVKKLAILTVGEDEAERLNLPDDSGDLVLDGGDTGAIDEKKKGIVEKLAHFSEEKNFVWQIKTKFYEFFKKFWSEEKKQQKMEEGKMATRDVGTYCADSFKGMVTRIGYSWNKRTGDGVGVPAALPGAAVTTS